MLCIPYLKQLTNNFKVPPHFHHEHVFYQPRTAWLRHYSACHRRSRGATFRKLSNIHGDQWLTLDIYTIIMWLLVWLFQIQLSNLPNIDMFFPLLVVALETLQSEEHEDDLACGYHAFFLMCMSAVVIQNSKFTASLEVV